MDFTDNDFENTKHNEEIDSPLEECPLNVLSQNLAQNLERIFSCGVHGTMYSIDSHPDQLVKEILIDGMPKDAFASLVSRLRLLPDLHCPHIAEYYDVSVLDETIYFRMKRYSTSLDIMTKILRRKKQSFPQNKILTVAKQVAQALAYLHDYEYHDYSGTLHSHLVHGNLRLSNILMDDSDSPQFVISDPGLYGIDQMNVGVSELWEQLCASPEIVLQNDYTPASDMWSVGIILYRLCTGSVPIFYKDNQPKDVFIEGWEPDLSGVKDASIRAIIEHLLILEPKDRLTAKELLDLLKEDSAPMTIVSYLGVKSLEKKMMKFEYKIERLEKENALLMIALKKCITPTSDSAFPIIAIKTPCNSNSAAQQKNSDDTPRTGSQTVTTKKKQFNANNTTQLMNAIRKNNINKVRMLINDPSELSKKDNLGMTALMHAAKLQNLGIANLLISHQHGLHDLSGKTAMMHAASGGGMAMVKLLVEKEAKLQDNHGMTALMYAIKFGHKKLAVFLSSIEFGIKTNTGKTALMYAAELANLQVITALLPLEAKLRDTANATALVYALKHKKLNAAAQLLPLEDPTDKSGCTALMRAVSDNNIEMIKLLVPLQAKQKTSNKVTLKASTVSHYTALMIAAANGKVEIARLLMNVEAQIQDEYGQTALMIAAQNNHHKVVKLLVEHEHGMKTQNGKTAAIIAGALGYKNIVNILSAYPDEMINS